MLPRSLLEVKGLYQLTTAVMNAATSLSLSLIRSEISPKMVGKNRNGRQNIRGPMRNRYPELRTLT